ncbi:hypothetical protein ACI2KR_08860 [Pseudomonas luteola]
MVTEIFDYAQSVAQWKISRFASYETTEHLAQTREWHLKHLYGHSDNDLYDGVIQAITNAEKIFSAMHHAQRLSIEDSLVDLFTSLKSRYEGLEQVCPKDFDKYLKLYDADEDIAFEFSETNKSQLMDAFIGEKARILWPLPESGSLYNTLSHVRTRNYDLHEALTSHVFCHAVCCVILNNNLEVEAELNKIKTDAPFVNERVELRGKWIDQAMKLTGLAQTGPFKMPSSSNGTPSQTTLTLKNDPIQNDDLKKQRASDLISSIYGSPSR